MCCIIHREVGKPEIKKEYLKMILKINDDGWGCSYLTNKNKIITRKSMDMSKAIDYIRTLEKRDVEFIFHARYTTLGRTDIPNCHPFNVKDGVMFHNGEIKGLYLQKKFSDSWHFALTITKYMKNRKWKIPTILKKYKDRIGPSRFAFLLNDGSIIKHGNWFEYDGIHYSKNNWYNKLNNNYNGNYLYSSYDMYGMACNDPYFNDDDYESEFSKKLKKHKELKYANMSDFEIAVIACESGFITDSHIKDLTTVNVCKLIRNYHTPMLNLFFRKRI